MGSSTVQGKLWGARARDFAERLEQLGLPLLGAALDAALITPGSRVLDAGSGAGLLAVLASFRGARVTALDASAPLLEIARERLPSADIRQGDLEALPFDEASFDAVIAVNSVFYATDIGNAIRELKRVVRPGGRVVITVWGSPDRCELLSEILPKIFPLMPPPPPGAPPPKPGALSEPGALEAAMQKAGLQVVDKGEVACPFVFPNAEASWLANASAGPNQLAIGYSGEAAVRAVFTTADRAHTRADGSIHYNNVFLWAAGVRP